MTVNVELYCIRCRQAFVEKAVVEDAQMGRVNYRGACPEDPRHPVRTLRTHVVARDEEE